MGRPAVSPSCMRGWSSPGARRSTVGSDAHGAPQRQATTPRNNGATVKVRLFVILVVKFK